MLQPILVGHCLFKRVKKYLYAAVENKYASDLGGKMRDIKKLKVAKPAFEIATGEWKTVRDVQQVEVARALSNPVRRAILRLLGLGPMRKAELARQIHRGLGKKYSRSLVQHHLKQLERAGLVGYVVDPKISNKTKFVYRSAEVRVQLKPEPAPEGVPSVPDELIHAALRRESRGEG